MGDSQSSRGDVSHMVHSNVSVEGEGDGACNWHTILLQGGRHANHDRRPRETIQDTFSAVLSHDREVFGAGEHVNQSGCESIYRALGHEIAIETRCDDSRV